MAYKSQSPWRSFFAAIIRGSCFYPLVIVFVAQLAYSYRLGELASFYISLLSLSFVMAFMMIPCAILVFHVGFNNQQRWAWFASAFASWAVFAADPGGRLYWFLD